MAEASARTVKLVSIDVSVTSKPWYGADSVMGAYVGRNVASSRVPA